MQRLQIFAALTYFVDAARLVVQRRVHFYSVSVWR